LAFEALTFKASAFAPERIPAEAGYRPEMMPGRLTYVAKDGRYWVRRAPEFGRESSGGIVTYHDILYRCGVLRDAGGKYVFTSWPTDENILEAEIGAYMFHGAELVTIYTAPLAPRLDKQKHTFRRGPHLSNLGSKLRIIRLDEAMC
jgi:hypothetical protein